MSIFLKGALIITALGFFLQILTGFFPAEISAFPLATLEVMLAGMTGIIQTGINFTAPIIDWAFVGILLNISIWLLIFGISWKVGIFVWDIVKHL